MRIFVAIDLAIPVVENLVLLQEDLTKPLEDLGAIPKWVPAENIHLTLKFIGEADEGLTYLVRDRVREIATSSSLFELQTLGTGCFPAPSAPRILWAGVGEGADRLSSLRDQIETAFAEIGIANDEREYRPHVTIGRIKTDKSRIDISEILSSYANTPYGTTHIRGLVVYESRLDRSGAIYRVVERCPFGNPNQ
ncbi:MAG: RNA 2',3'-cyclic phosphodiesterase [Myxococcales bacterium]|nr:RNA 2',3'-cyclic phosphodiesterase [Myxococcales bacterium]